MPNSVFSHRFACFIAYKWDRHSWQSGLVGRFSRLATMPSVQMSCQLLIESNAPAIGRKLRNGDIWSIGKFRQDQNPYGAQNSPTVQSRQVSDNTSESHLSVVRQLASFCSWRFLGPIRAHFDTWRNLPLGEWRCRHCERSLSTLASNFRLPEMSTWREMCPTWRLR